MVDNYLVSLIDGEPHRLDPDRSDLLPSMTAVPAPDGHVIAVVNDGSGLVYPDLHQFVSFFEPTTLAVIGGPYLCPKGECAITWTPSGDLIVADLNHLGANTLSLDGRFTPVAAPGCFDPPTTSSPVSTSGDVVSIDSAGTVSFSRGAGVPFRCQ